MRTITRNELFEKLGHLCYVERAEGRRTGQSTNHFIIHFVNGEMFQSYQTLIGARIKGEYYWSDSHSCSNTTSTNTTIWCRMSAEERRKALASGEAIRIID